MIINNVLISEYIAMIFVSVIYCHSDLPDLFCYLSYPIKIKSVMMLSAKAKLASGVPRMLLDPKTARLVSLRYKGRDAP